MPQTRDTQSAVPSATLGHTLPQTPQWLGLVASSSHVPEQQLPPAQVVSSVTFVHAVVLVAGWHDWQAFIGLAAPEA
jgi:hypothetical protein